MCYVLPLPLVGISGMHMICQDRLSLLLTKPFNIDISLLKSIAVLLVESDIPVFVVVTCVTSFVIQ